CWIEFRELSGHVRKTEPVVEPYRGRATHVQRQRRAGEHVPNQQCLAVQVARLFGMARAHPDGVVPWAVLRSRIRVPNRYGHRWPVWASDRQATVSAGTKVQHEADAKL